MEWKKGGKIEEEQVEEEAEEEEEGDSGRKEVEEDRESVAESESQVGVVPSSPDHLSSQTHHSFHHLLCIPQSQ